MSRTTDTNLYCVFAKNSHFSLIQKLWVGPPCSVNVVPVQQLQITSEKPIRVTIELKEVRYTLQGFPDSYSILKDEKTFSQSATSLSGYGTNGFFCFVRINRNAVRKLTQSLLQVDSTPRSRQDPKSLQELEYWIKYISKVLNLTDFYKHQGMEAQSSLN